MITILLGNIEVDDVNLVPRLADVRVFVVVSLREIAKL